MKLTRIFLCTLLICSSTNVAFSQGSIAEFQKLLREKASFNDADLSALQTNQPVVRLSPASDKREVAVSGVVNVRATAEEFLQSYRDSMMRKSNAAIMEIGGFGKEPDARLSVEFDLFVSGLLYQQMTAVFADSEHWSICKLILAKIGIVDTRVDSDLYKRVFPFVIEPFHHRRVRPLLAIVRILTRGLFQSG